MKGQTDLPTNKPEAVFVQTNYNRYYNHFRYFNLDKLK